MITFVHKRQHWQARAGCAVLALHFLFVFCAVDLFHADACPVQDRNCNIPLKSEADNGCPACMFKAGAHAEQPEMLGLSVSVLPVFLCVFTPVDTVQVSEPCCWLRLRAPPAA